MCPFCQHWGGHDKRWLTEMGWVISTWLFSVSFMVDVLWWMLTCDTKILTCCIHSHALLHASTLRPPCPSIQSFYFYAPWPACHNICLWVVRPLLCLYKVDGQVYCLSSAHWEGFPLPLSVPPPEWGCNAAPVHFLLVHTYSYVWKMWGFFLCQPAIGPPLGPKRYMLKEGHLYNSGGWYDGLGPLLKLVTSGPICAWSWLYHFHLVLDC